MVVIFLVCVIGQDGAHLWAGTCTGLVELVIPDRASTEM